LKTALNGKVKIARYSLENYTNEVFANQADANTLWFNHYDIMNVNGTYNKLVNYGVQYNFYDLQNNISKNVDGDEHLLTKHSFKDKRYVGQKVDRYNFGILNNFYPDFYQGLTLNHYNKTDFFGYGLLLNINSISNVKLLDMVDVSIPNQPTFNNGDYNEMLSGKYLVGGIIYMVSKGGMFEKKISLHRNGFNESFAMKSYRVS